MSAENLRDAASNYVSRKNRASERELEAAALEFVALWLNDLKVTYPEDSEDRKVLKQMLEFLTWRSGSAYDHPIVL